MVWVNYELNAELVLRYWRLFVNRLLASHRSSRRPLCIERGRVEGLGPLTGHVSSFDGVVPSVPMVVSESLHGTRDCAYTWIAALEGAHSNRHLLRRYELDSREEESIGSGLDNRVIHHPQELNIASWV